MITFQVSSVYIVAVQAALNLTWFECPKDISAATRENRSSGSLTSSDTNRPVQSGKQSRSLKLPILEGEKLYYACSETKGADQLHSFCEADLRLCFRLGKNLVFSRCGSYFPNEDVFSCRVALTGTCFLCLYSKCIYM